MKRPMSTIQDRTDADAGEATQADSASKETVALAKPKNLTKAEKQQLQKLQACISKGLSSFVEVGKALATIRDKQLYREASSNFESHCAACWDMSRQHAYRLIAAAQCYEAIRAGAGDSCILPQTESQVRPLLKHLPSDRWVSAWKHAVSQSKGKCPTAAKVVEIVQTINGTDPTPKSGPARKRSRKPISAKALAPAVRLASEAISNKEATIDQLRDALREIKKRLEKLNQS